MNVVQIDRYRNKETVAVLEALLAMARGGDVRGVALCFKLRDGTEKPLVTDCYAGRTDSAAAAFLRLSMRMVGVRGEYDGPP